MFFNLEKVVSGLELCPSPMLCPTDKANLYLEGKYWKTIIKDFQTEKNKKYYVK
jgi:hypothetical protein